MSQLLTILKKDFFSEAVKKITDSGDSNIRNNIICDMEMTK